MTRPLDILYDNGPVLVINKPAGVLTQAPAGIDSLEVRVKEFYRQREGEGGQHLPRPAPSARPAGLRGDRLRPPRAGGPADLDAVRKSHGHQGLLGVRRRPGRSATKAPGPTTSTSGTAWPSRSSCRRTTRAASWPSCTGGCWPGPTAGTWLEVQLETGRTHQIRVQAASRGHAVVGDTQYGATQPFGEQFEDERLRAIALHARQLGFNHPMTREPVDVIAPLPAAWRIAWNCRSRHVQCIELATDEGSVLLRRLLLLALAAVGSTSSVVARLRFASLIPISFALGSLFDSLAGLSFSAAFLYESLR